MKRVFFVFLFLSLSLSEEQTKGAKRAKIHSRLKNSPFRRKSRVVSIRLFFFIFHFSHEKYEKKKPNAFWSIQIALTRRGFYISHRESHFFFSVACSLALGSASRSVGKHTHTHTHRASSYHGASDALAHPDELLSGFGRGE